MNSVGAINNTFQIGNVEALAESLREKALQAQAAATAAATVNQDVNTAPKAAQTSVASPVAQSILPFNPATISASSLENSHRGLDPSRVASLLGLE